MRLLVVSDRYPPHYVGGYEFACHAVIERLRARGHDVAVVTSTFGVPGPCRQGHVHRVLHRPQDSADLLRLARWEIADNRALARIAAAWRPTVIYAWSMLQLFASLHRTVRDLGVPVVYNIQDLWIPTQLEGASRLREVWVRPGTSLVKRAVKRAVRAANGWRWRDWERPVTMADVDLRHVVFCTRFRQTQHVARGLPLGESAVIPNGVDLRLFDGPIARPGANALRVLFVGRLVHEKGAHTAIEALAALARRGGDSVTLSIRGVPSYPWEYVAGVHRLVEEFGLGDRVRFLDSLAQTDLPRLYRQHDVLVFPSIGDEGFPMTLLEAMACGVPVVSTLTGGTAEILTDGVNCLAFAPGDAGGLAAGLAGLMARPDVAAGLARRAQALVREQFDIEVVCDDTERYLTRLPAA